MNDLDDGLVTETFTEVPLPPAGPAAPALAAAVAMAVTDFDTSAQVKAAVQAEIAKEVRKFLTAAMAGALTEERCAQLAAQASDAVDLEFEAIAAKPAGPTAEDDVDDEVENHFPNVYVFVSDFLIHIYAHPVRAQDTTWRWCSRWWEHTEAVSRLEALWKAFEVLRRDPGTGASIWWRDYGDPTMAALTASSGTFAKCSDTTHTTPPSLPMEKPSDWLLQSDGSALTG